MKKYILSFLAFVALTCQAQVQPTTALKGSWSGKLKVGTMSLTVVLHLEQADGYVKASLDSPDQSAYGIPALKEFLSDDSVAVKVEAIGRRKTRWHFLADGDETRIRDDERCTRGKAPSGA